MDELVKTLRDFITRDLLYVVGGGVVGLSYCCLFQVAVPPSPSTEMALLAIGIAYGVGYAIQDGLSLTAIVTTAPVVNPGRMVRFLYRRFVRAAWSEIDLTAFNAAKEAFATIASDRDYAQWNRIVSLKHIGSTLGSCGLVAALLLAAAAVRTRGESSAVALAAAALTLGATLLGLSWVKGAQQSQFVLSVHQHHLNAQAASGDPTQGPVDFEEGPEKDV